MKELKDITEVLSETQVIEETEEVTEEEAELTEEEASQCDSCKTCKNWIKLYMAPTAMGYSGCKWLKQNHYVLAGNRGGLNAPFLISATFIPDVFDKCKGYEKKD